MLKTLYVLFLILSFHLKSYASTLSCNTSLEGSRLRVIELLKRVCTTSNSAYYEDSYKRNIKERIRGILPQEKAIIIAFTNECYRQINTNLRSSNEDSFAFELSSYLMHGLCKYPKKRGIVYRGVKYSQEDFIRHEAGMIVDYKGFSSTSEDLYTALRFAVNAILVIDSHSGRKIHFSSLVEEEKEILILPGTKFKILSNKEIFIQGRLMREIRMKEVSISN